MGLTSGSRSPKDDAAAAFLHISYRRLRDKELS